MDVTATASLVPMSDPPFAGDGPDASVPLPTGQLTSIAEVRRYLKTISLPNSNVTSGFCATK
jgi:hypothetical protein